MHHSPSSSTHAPSIGLPSRARSAYGEPVTAASTVNTEMDRLSRRHTFPPSSRASQSLSQHLRDRSFSQFRINPSARSKTDTQYTKPNLSSGFDQATGDTHKSDTMTASPFQTSPTQSLCSASPSPTHQSFELPSQPSPSSTNLTTLKAIKGSDGYYQFPEFDQLQADNKREEENKKNKKTTETSTSPSRSSSEQTSIGDTLAPDDDLNRSSQPDARTQAGTSSSTPPSHCSPTPADYHVIDVIHRVRNEKHHREMTGIGIRAH